MVSGIFSGKEQGYQRQDKRYCGYDVEKPPVTPEEETKDRTNDGNYQKPAAEISQFFTKRLRSRVLTHVSHVRKKELVSDDVFRHQTKGTVDEFKLVKDRDGMLSCEINTRLEAVSSDEASDHQVFALLLIVD